MLDRARVLPPSTEAAFARSYAAVTDECGMRAGDPLSGGAASVIQRQALADGQCGGGVALSLLGDRVAHARADPGYGLRLQLLQGGGGEIGQHEEPSQRGAGGGGGGGPG